MVTINNRIAGGKRAKQAGKPIILTLPYPPSANLYWRTAVQRGYVKTYVSKEAEAFKTNVLLLARQAGVEMLDGELGIGIKIYRPQKSGDLDNRIKVLIDALRGVAYADDNQIVLIFAKRFDDKLNPRAEVCVECAAIKSDVMLPGEPAREAK